MRSPNKTHTNFIILFCIGFFLSSFAQSDVSYQSNFPRISHIGLEDGLPDRQVKDIIEDEAGFFWILFLSGVYKYDGYQFTNLKDIVNNPEEYPNGAGGRIAQQKNGNLWMIIDKKLYAYNKLSNRIIDLSTLNINTNFPITLAEDGSLFSLGWIGNDQYKLVKITPSFEEITFDTLSFDRKVQGDKKFKNLKIDAKGQLWVLSNHTGIIIYNQEGKKVDEIEIGEELSRGNRVFMPQIEFDEHQNIFLLDYENRAYWRTEATQNGKPLKQASFPFNFDRRGVEGKKVKSYLRKVRKEYGEITVSIVGKIFSFDSNTKDWTLLETARLPLNSGNIFVDSKQQFWIFNLQANLLFKVSQNNIWDYTNALGKVQNYSRVFRLFEDSKNMIWICTDNGIFKFSNQSEQFQNILYTENSSWGKTTRGFMEDKEGNVYVRCESCGTSFNDGIFKIDAKSQADFLVTILPSIENSDAILWWTRNFLKDKFEDKYWGLSSTYLNLIDINDRRSKTYTIPDSIRQLNLRVFNPIVQTEEGLIIFGDMIESLVCFNPKTEKFSWLFPPNQSPYKEQRTIRSLYLTQDGHLWVGSESSGLIEIDLKEKKILHEYHQRTHPKLEWPQIVSLYEDDNNNLWIATLGGLHYLNREKQQMEVFTTSDGLCNNKVVGILPWKKDYLWISTYYGLSRFHIPTQTFVNYYEEDGLTHNEFNYTSHFIDSKGRYYFGGMNGVNVFHPDSLVKQDIPFRVFPTQLNIYNEKEDTIISQKDNLDLLDKIELSPFDAWFQLDFAISNFKNTNANQYQTWLEGIEKDWTYQGNNRTIRYNRLPAGNYTLHIKGADAKGNWSETISIPIHVQQIFYKSWWFLTLCFLGAIGIVYGIFRYRFLQKMKMEQMRSQISSDLHDEVGSSLTRLSMIMNSVEVKEDDFSKKYFQKGNEVLTNAIARIRDVVWAIDARNDQGGNLIDRMEDFAFDMLRSKNILYKIKVENFNRKEVLPPMVRQNIYLIYKEAITNIVKHSNATQVQVDFYKKDKTLHLKIKDNGQNLNGKKVKGSGLSNMQLRAKRVGGTVEIQPDEQGFMVELEVGL